MSKTPSKVRLEDSLSLPGNQRHSKLEEAFFLKEDQKLIEHLRALKKMKDSKEALIKVSGITNDAILTRLIELGVRPETLASLMLIPLLEVAWADGQVDREERKAVLLAATESGFNKGHIDYELLRNWMNHRPAPKLIQAWKQYMAGLCEHLKPAEIDSLKKEMLKHAKEIAEASGGILGLGIGDRISPEEKAVLAKLEKAFSKTK